MSQENAELVHRAYAALQAGDVDRWVSYFDPEVEFSWTAMEGLVRGHEGLREWATGLLAAFRTGSPPSWRYVT
jgi:ketosteroid isomerase-like protein